MDWMIQEAGTLVTDLLANGMDILEGLKNWITTVQTSAQDDGLSLEGIVEGFNDYIRISPLTNDHVLGLADYLMEFGIKHAEKMTGVARALGAVFAIIVAGKEAYKVMAEQRGFDILDILRPILFAFVLAFWGPLVNTVIAPGHAIEQHCKGLYEVANVRMDSLRQERFNRSTKLGNDIREQRALVKQQEESQAQGSSAVWQTILSGVTELFSTLREMAVTAIATVETAFKDMLDRIIIWIGEVAYTVAIYIIFVLKALFVTVLAMFGPVYMAASILPAWKDAWKQWIERIVNVSMYGAMAYLAMAFSTQLICYNLESDIMILTDIVDDEASLLAYLRGSLGSTCSTAVSYFVGCFAMKAVPEMASMCFPGTASHAASAFIGGLGGKAYGASVGLATKAVTKGKG